MMGPLKGIRIIEMAGLAPGPFAAMMLADMGAQILRIERPGQLAPPGHPNIELLNRSRDVVALDLKSAAGIATLQRLLVKADAFIEGFRPGVMERLGLGPDICLAANPRLVYGRMTGWGQNGPLASAAGHDLNYIALTGALHSIGRKGEPPSVPLNLVGDFGGGGMYLAFGIVCALLEARQSGQGQVVDAAMVDGAASLMTYMFASHASGAWSDTRGENVLDGETAPWYGVYETSDGGYVTIASAEPQFYAELLRLTGLAGQADLPDQLDRASWPAFRARLAEVFRGRTRAEWCDIMEGSNVCFAPVLNLAESIAHPHNRARGTFVEVDGVAQPAPAPRFSRTSPDRPTLPKSLAGTDTTGVLAAWGFELQEVQALREAGAFGPA
ncbi:CaiB/BaiF CoA-transferase family protein [Variovorax sp. dw_954]|uniref:CaiB/BaiF CoA transferase family protein n=1 Tax=Variovorax sp. dw_954 TaxID=2720078 RepID=UPI001BD6A7E2|nr:CaiB/BaiF CoA-transferase family protein [Variovorax sp. dw_954]